jgi:carbonic anhydrase/acetyltransferase-like protein (isoleucine patch superfamily)
MPIFPYRDKHPQIDPTAFVAPGAMIVGDVVLEAGASVWFNAVLRGDSSSVRVEAGTNIQDGAVLHTDADAPCILEEGCTVGHLAIVHGCRVGRGTLIGMGAVVLSRAEIGEESLVGAGALVGEGRRIRPRSLMLGHPARLIRTLTDEEVERLIRPGARHYREYADAYRRSGVGR